MVERIQGSQAAWKLHVPGTASSLTPRAEPITTQNVVGVDAPLADLLSFPPVAPEAVILQLNGVTQDNGAGLDFTVSGQTITWLAGSGTAVDLSASDSAFVYYWS